MWFGRLLDAIQSLPIFWKRLLQFAGASGRIGVRYSMEGIIIQVVTLPADLVLLEEFQAANELSTPPIVKETIKWSPPALGLYKLNIDGAIFSQIKATGLGMVIRDDAGLVVAAMSKKISISLGPLEAEVKAMEAAIQFGIDIGVREVTFETDSLLLYNALQGNNAAASSIENVVSGILF